MEVIRFDSEDVIATSAIPSLDALLDQGASDVPEIPEPGAWG